MRTLKSYSAGGLFLLAGIALSGQVWALCPDPINLPNPATSTVQYGDAQSYALPLLGISVQSSPGQIDDCPVLATGVNGVPMTTNVAGMDYAYSTPDGTGGLPYFRTGDPLSSPDPGALVAFAGQTATTWDAQLSALSTFLDGSSMIFYFNLNQTNSGGAVDQNLFAWAQIALVDVAGVLPTLYFDFTAIAPDHSGIPGGNPTTYNSPGDATSTYPTGADSSFPSTDDFVRANGQVCLAAPGTPGVSPIVDCSTPGAVAFNLNLGANEVAYAVYFQELQAYLNMAGFGGYEVMQVDFRMGCNPDTVAGEACEDGSVLNNGFEQLFIGRANIATNGNHVPEPSTLALFGLGMLGLWGSVRMAAHRRG
jgi:hypothetical protein